MCVGDLILCLDAEVLSVVWQASTALLPCLNFEGEASARR